MQTIVFSTLKDHIELLQQLSKEQYTTTITELSNATIGQHTRHFIELYQCLNLQYSSGEINYDLRKRNKDIETDVSFAIQCIYDVIENINKPNKDLILIVPINGNTTAINTNYHRELYYNLEHCIHHQALIKVALIKITNISYSDTFGVANSTLQHRIKCAQ